MKENLVDLKNTYNYKFITIKKSKYHWTFSLKQSYIQPSLEILLYSYKMFDTKDFSMLEF